MQLIESNESSKVSMYLKVSIYPSNVFYNLPFISNYYIYAHKQI